MSRIAGLEFNAPKNMYDHTQDVLLNILYHYQRRNNFIKDPKVYISGEYFEGCKKHAEKECKAEMSEDNKKITFCNGTSVYVDDNLIGPQLRIENE